MSNGEEFEKWEVDFNKLENCVPTRFDAWKAAITSMQPEIDAMKAQVDRLGIGWDGATAEAKMLGEENAALRAANKDLQSHFDALKSDYDAAMESNRLLQSDYMLGKEAGKEEWQDKLHEAEDEIIALRARAEKAEAELKAAREQAPSGYVDGDQFRRWEVLRGTEFESPERCYMPFSVEPYESDINNCDTPLYRHPLPPAHEWMPIETAPRTSTAVLVFCPDNQCTFCVSFDIRDESWMYFGGGMLSYKPSHWMPLPKSPARQRLFAIVVARAFVVKN